MGKSKKHNSDDEGSKIGAKNLKNKVPDFLGKSRSCTDVICLLVFVVFLIAWIIVGVFAFKDGHPEDILNPLNSESKRCGIDEGVKDKPYLFYFDLTNCRPENILKCHTPQVCVETCPTDNFQVDYFLKNPDPTKLAFVISKLICRNGVDKSVLRSFDDVKNAVNEEKCARWYLASKPIGSRCLPRQISDLKDTVNGISINITVDNSGKLASDVVNGVSGKHLIDAAVVVKSFAAVGEFGESVLRDLKKSWEWIVLLILIAALVSLVYIVIMRWITSIMVWFSLLGSVGLLAFSTYYTWTKYQELGDKASDIRSQSNQKLTRDTEDEDDYFDKLLKNRDTWLGFFIISVILLIIILLILLFLRKRIRIAVALINEGSKAVSHSWTALVFPIFPWICQLIVIAYGIAIFVFLLGSGIQIYRVNGLSSTCGCSNIYQDGYLCEPSIFNSTCNVNEQGCEGVTCALSDVETRDYAPYFHLFNLLMALWGMFFVSGFGEMVLAGSFSRYYWTFDKSDLPFFMMGESVYTVIRYHLGTIAFGSFLIALCNWIRWLIEIAHNQLNKTNNPILKGVKCCCVCFFWCLEKFLKFLSKNAYIMCAMRGKNFCLSARKAFNLILRNVLRVAVLDGVTGYIFFLNKLLITSIVGVIAFFVFSKPLPELTDLEGNKDIEFEYYFVPIIVVCICAYFIASVFFSVYDMAVDTLFLCFLLDSEKNDGSPEKPYFMSKELMKILGKKNKKLK